MKKIGIHKGAGFTTRWAEAIVKHGHEVCWLDLLGGDPIEQARHCDGIMWHWAHYPHETRMAALPILHTIEEYLKIPIWPDMATCWHFDNKIAQAYLLTAVDIPTPKTWVFWRKQDALKWAGSTVYPVVAKLSGGAGSMNVVLLRTHEDAITYINKCFSGSGIISYPPPAKGWRRWPSAGKRLIPRVVNGIAYAGINRFPAMPDQTYWMPQKNHAYFQEFIPDNEFDTRVTVIGNRAFAYRRFNRKNDFRASGSGNFDVTPSKIDRRCLMVAFETNSKLKAQSIAFDFLFNRVDRQPVIGEVSYCYVDWMVHSCPGYWDSQLNWHEGQMWPEEAHVLDFLHRFPE